ncbi:c-type cytochrome biogenesis protein CcmI [Granulosicoccaceae sp. 1_MG-2023]|nr:c-type cytochrome biogenesis protein CcmI [Granulosicoccaceae sp. 1_MG-2023]
MITFWLIAALLTVLALAVLLAPLLRKSAPQEIGDERRAQNIAIAKERIAALEAEHAAGDVDEEEYKATLDELELSLLEDVNEEQRQTHAPQRRAWFTAVVLAALTPLGGVFVYQQLGNPRAVTVAPVAAAPDAQNGGDMNQMLAQLEARLETDPDDLDSWYLLGRTHMAQQNYAKAVAAFDHILTQQPEAAEVMLLKADAMAMAADGKLAGEPAALIADALALDPDNFTGLWLSGMAAREAGDTDTALQQWYRLRELLPADSPDRDNLEQLIAQTENGNATPSGMPDIAEMVGTLEDKLKAEPENPTGWLMLGRSYMVLQRFPDAVGALETALEQDAENPEVMLALADAMAMTQGGRLSGRPAELVTQALANSPQNPKALWLAGLAANEAGDKAAAIGHWETLLPLIQSDPQSVREVESLISEARGEKPEATPDSAATGGLSVTVALSDEVREAADESDSVFIYAKAVSGPPMPLAAKRLTVADLPVTLTLNDNDAMMPQLTLSSQAQVIVGARVTKSGQAIAQSGDYVAESEAVSNNGEVSLTISEQLP